MIYDITRTVKPSLSVWPGDKPYTVETVLEMRQGASVNLTTLHMSPHTGSHADAYYHYTPDGEHPAEMSLEPYIGTAWVVHTHKLDGPLLPSDLSLPDGVQPERLLIRSHVSDLPDDAWPAQFPYLSLELISWLKSAGTKLIGLDSPSVDAFDSKDLPCHHALRTAEMVNLELLLLRGVPVGCYELIALPLRLDLACGSPVRAVLREFEGSR